MRCLKLINFKKDRLVACRTIFNSCEHVILFRINKIKSVKETLNCIRYLIT